MNTGLLIAILVIVVVVVLVAVLLGNDAVPSDCSSSSVLSTSAPWPEAGTSAPRKPI